MKCLQQINGFHFAQITPHSSLFRSFPPTWIPGAPAKNVTCTLVRTLLLNFLFFFQNVGLILPSFPILSFISVPVYDNSLVENSLA